LRKLEPPVTVPAFPETFRSPLRYPGGKQRAIQQIAEMLPTKVSEYREPMVGGGSVYFYAKTKCFAKKYWINDKFEDLVDFWSVVQDEELCSALQADLKRLKKRLKSPEEIKDYFVRSKSIEPVDKYHRALLFFFYNRVTFSGTTKAGGFSKAASTLRFTDSSIDRLKAMPAALRGTTITNEDFEHVIRKPGKDVFLFIDPPYFTASKLYGKDGSLHDFPHKRLASILKSSGHKFLLTYDDCDEIFDLYASWANVRSNIKPWMYGMNNCGADNKCKVGAELFISNY
jgi:DNA adenine methylase